jgi:Gas vesicle protein
MATRRDPLTGGQLPTYGRADLRPRESGPANLADILERVLDKGIVIAGDIQINLLEIELLTIKLRLLVASVDRAREMGINWWESDPTLSTDAQDRELERENRDLRGRVERLERLLESGESGSDDAANDDDASRR